MHELDIAPGLEILLERNENFRGLASPQLCLFIAHAILVCKKGIPLERFLAGKSVSSYINYIPAKAPMTWHRQDTLSRLTNKQALNCEWQGFGCSKTE